MKQRKEDRRSQRTNRLVSSAMTELLFEKRYEAITVQDLLDRANIGRSTFYAHYFDKEDVLASMLEQLLETLRKPLSHGEAGEGIIPSLELFRFVYQHPHQQHFQAMWRGQAGEMFWEATRRALNRIIEQALVADRAEKGPTLMPLEVVSEYLSGAFLNLMKWWIAADMPYTPEEMDKIFQRLALRGVWGAIEEGRE